LPGLSRRQLREIIASGAVRVNGRRAHKGILVRRSDVVWIDPAARALAGGPAPQPELALSVLCVDDAIIAVDKPSGRPATARRPGDRDTVANALLAHFPEVAESSASALEAGLVHRLDTGTSGILLAARTSAAYRDLRAQFASRRIGKLYLAVAAGTVAGSGRIAIPIAHAPGQPDQMRLGTDRGFRRGRAGRFAQTRYRALRRGADRSLVAVAIATGVRHQIRVHLAAIGHPIVGDPLYGVAPVAPGRLLLHAARLRFRHPTSGAIIVLHAPLPAEFLSVRPGW
jgi:23S rRNA pseudouridine1911/1915/1917 synthase